LELFHTDIIVDFFNSHTTSFHQINDEIHGDDQTHVETNGKTGNYGTTTDTANDAASLIKLNNGMVLCLRGVNRYINSVLNYNINQRNS
jgi:hypothetical protein